MAVGAKVHKVELQVSDLDRHHYGTHPLVLAQHPSETDERVMLRVLAYALFADERLEFGRGLSTDDEPDLWRRDLTGAIEQWIELGQPDESRVRKACGRAREVVVITYGGRAADLWWEKNAAAGALAEPHGARYSACGLEGAGGATRTRHAVAGGDPGRPRAARRRRRRFRHLAGPPSSMSGLTQARAAVSRTRRG